MDPTEIIEETEEVVPVIPELVNTPPYFEEWDEDFMIILTEENLNSEVVFELERPQDDEFDPV